MSGAGGAEGTGERRADATGGGAEERALIERAAAGDRGAQDALLRRYLPVVYQLTYRLLGRREQAEDAAQDAMLSALRALPRFRGEASFRTWLLRIATNAARSQGRRASRRHERELGAAEHVAGAGRDPAQAAEQGSELARVEQALALLPPRQRLVVTLRVQQGMSYTEIAAATGSSEGAARVNYHLGIKRLRELLR